MGRCLAGTKEEKTNLCVFFPLFPFILCTLFLLSLYCDIFAHLIVLVRLSIILTFNLSISFCPFSPPIFFSSLLCHILLFLLSLLKSIFCPFYFSLLLAVLTPSLYPLPSCLTLHLPIFLFLSPKCNFSLLVIFFLHSEPFSLPHFLSHHLPSIFSHLPSSFSPPPPPPLHLPLSLSEQLLSSPFESV